MILLSGIAEDVEQKGEGLGVTEQAQPLTYLEGLMLTAKDKSFVILVSAAGHISCCDNHILSSSILDSMPLVCALGIVLTLQCSLAVFVICRPSCRCFRRLAGVLLLYQNVTKTDFYDCKTR